MAPEGPTTAHPRGIHIDGSQRPDEVGGGLDFETGWLSPGEQVFQYLREEQAQAVLAVIRSEHLSPILEMPTGAGKCLGPSVPVLRADGLVVRADEVREAGREGQGGEPERTAEEQSGG